MTTYDFERPFISASSLPLWESHDPKVSAQFGRRFALPRCRMSSTSSASIASATRAR